MPDAAAMMLLEREKSGAPALSPDEKTSLERARTEHLADYLTIVAERFPALRGWLLENACE